MALKDLLVYVDQTERSLVRLRLAADLAVRHGSRLTALYAREWTRAQLDWRLVSADRARAVARWRRVGGKDQTQHDLLLLELTESATAGRR